MLLHNLVVTVDGPAGAGKSTVAKKVALALGIPYMDTGALYRALAYSLDAQGVLPEESDVLLSSLRSISVTLSENRVFVDAQDASDLIRTPHVGRLASAYSALPAVREKLLDIQREQTLNGGLVADGRDMGTVVFPLAPLKIFLTASEDIRARRRWEELKAKGDDLSFESVLEDMKRRDLADRERACAPLRKAEDAVVVDSSNLSVDQVVQVIVSLALEVSHG
ncbi:MAG: cytidylate kinase [Dethiosulfovibrio peptidovorans]|nr:MAG: cytidylate kinase [Dethiosulfovibrio peptidovorans]